MHQAEIPFGTHPNGSETTLYLLTNDAGMTVGVTDLGATLVSCRVPDGKGHRPDVVLGYDGAADYADNGSCFGAIVGRVANRIAGARFELGGNSYRLAANEGHNSNHSGPHAWYHRMWKRVPSAADTLAFELTSRRGDQGFPGSVQASVRYRLTEDNRLELSFEALPSEPTLVNLTCHAYWNLNGHASGSALGHTLSVDADQYTPADEAHIPTGEIADVAGTELDLREPTVLDDALGAGYDTSYLVRNDGHHLRHAARLVGEHTGIELDVLTNSPALQVYTGKHLDEHGCKDGAYYGPGAGVALETQFPPDAIHHKAFPQPVFTPDVPFRARTVFAFTAGV